MSWEGWQNPETKRFWSGVLDELEEIAKEVAAGHPAEWNSRVIRAQWDAPNVELRWESLGLERNVNMLVVGTALPAEIEFTGAAWLDEDDSRLWIRQIDFSQPEPMHPLNFVSDAELAQLAPVALEDAVAQVQSIRRAAAAGAAGR